jgi:L-fuculokinase
LKKSKGDIVIVFDCGATNVRVIAINSKGVIVASESFKNNTSADPNYRNCRIWDVSVIWKKLCHASQKVMSVIDRNNVAGITITTFGVDGTFFDRNGKMLYPVISWQCDRTRQILKDIDKYLRREDLYRISGVYPFHFNTLMKLIWFVNNKPEIIDRSSTFLFMPSIFALFLTGNMVNDVTMAGTSMFTDLHTRNYSGSVLASIGFPESGISGPVEPGTITGEVTIKAYESTGIPAGTPVVATGHDTQFAIFGSGAAKNEAVLSSGTWEVLMARAAGFRTESTQYEDGITTEFDSRPGLYNIGNQWIASGVTEWVKTSFFNGIKKDTYENMISGAEKIPRGSNGVRFALDMDSETGGSISGLRIGTTPYEIYRATLEALSSKLLEGKLALEKAGGFKTESILCVGGGSKNRLWNQLKADAAGVPVKIIDHKETTVLGASMFVQAAVGNADSPEDARSLVNYKTEIILPNRND